MVYVLYLLAATGLAFLIGNRIPVLHRLAQRPGRLARWLDHFLECSFCQGFLSGGALWGFSWLGEGLPLLVHADRPGWVWPVMCLIWMLACGVASLGLDTWMDERSGSGL